MERAWEAYFLAEADPLMAAKDQVMQESFRHALGALIQTLTSEDEADLSLASFRKAFVETEEGYFDGADADVLKRALQSPCQASMGELELFLHKSLKYINAAFKVDRFA